jgi:hypothetical protein
MRSVLAFGIAAAVAALLGCSQNLVQVRDTGRTEALSLRRVAVTPFRAQPRAGAQELPAGASDLIASYVAEGLAQRGLDVVPASDVAQAVGAEQGADLRRSLSVASEQFGADALVSGTVYRFRDRDGEALGTLHPASAGFDVRIHRAGDGKLLWSGVFDHTQVPLGENALTAAQYPGGGTRWLTAEELARWGAHKITQEIPLAK